MPVACNYDPVATVDNESCDFSCYGGCMTPTACNYDDDALYPDGSCLFALQVRTARATVSPPSPPSPPPYPPPLLPGLYHPDLNNDGIVSTDLLNFLAIGKNMI